MKKTLFIITALAGLAICDFAGAAAFNTKAKSAFLLDYDSGAELVSKEADTLMPPSSMMKLMTLAVAFDAVKDGELKLNSKMIVSENADYQNSNWAQASKICLIKGQQISVNDALMGLIVMSGGDAGVVLAEKLAGSESAFTNKMMKKARSIGMEKSTFGNVSGLPHPDNLMTSRELGILAEYIISEYPKFYPMFATKRFEFNGYASDWCRDWGKTHTLNYNKLLFIMPGADGLKTGHTEDGGYGMVASATSGGRRLIGVINGLNVKSHESLAKEMKRMLEWGFKTTRAKIFYNAGADIVKVPVWYGRESFVMGTVKRNFAITLSADENISGLRVLARYADPAPAPINKGDKIGEVIAEMDGKVIARAPLVAKEKVGKSQLFGRVIKNLKYLFF